MSQKPTLTLTPAAVVRVKHLLAQDTAALGLRVGLDEKGCSGFAYAMEHVHEERKEDLKVTQDGVNIYIDPAVTLYLFGTEMDFVTEELSSKFVFNNPNAKGTCGCGESFHV